MAELGQGWIQSVVFYIFWVSSSRGIHPSIAPSQPMVSPLSLVEFRTVFCGPFLYELERLAWGI